MNNIGYEQSGHIYLESNSFKKLFSKYFDNITIDNTDNCDLIIKSPLSGNIWNKNKKPYIYWSGESRDIQHSKYHTKYMEILSFHSENPNSIYIPFCLESENIYKERINTNLNRQYIIGYCSSNQVQIREELFNKFVEKAGIDNCVSMGNCYGKYKETQQLVGGNFQGYGIIHSYSKCKFILAIENCKKNGYITEKIINAYYSGAIPIYWGSQDINELFNKDSFINVDDFKSFDDCINYVLNLSDEERENILKQPFYRGDLINILNDEYNKNNENKVLKKYENIIYKFFND